MALMQALALLAGGMAGYQKRGRDDKEDARRAEDDAWTREQRDRQRQEWTQKDQDRADAKAEKGRMAKAAAPVEAQDATVYQPAVDDEGNAMPANPTAGWRSVEGQVIKDPSKVAGAVQAANMPSAAMGRMAAATSDPTAAVNLRAGAAKAQADEAAQARQEKIRDIVGTLASGGAAAIPEIYARYNDGYDAEVVPGQNGGFTVRRMKDGKPAGEVPFKDMEDFIVRAVGSMNPDLYVSSMQKRREQEAKAAQDAAELQLRRDALAETGRHNKRMEGIAATRATASERKAGEAVGLDMDAADKFINTLMTTKDEMTGRTVFDPMGAQAVRSLMLRMPAAQGGDTQGAVNQALAVYQEALKVSGGDHGKAMAAIEAAGKPKAAAAPAPAAGKPAAPAAPPRPAENLAPFRAMSDDELARYANAGNQLALAVQRERAAQARASAGPMQQRMTIEPAN